MARIFIFVGLDGREAAVARKDRLKSTRPYHKRARSVSRMVIGIRPATRPNIHRSLERQRICTSKMCVMLTVTGIGTLILLVETAANLQDSKPYPQPKHGENKEEVFCQKEQTHTSLAIASQRSSCGCQAKWVSSDVDLAGWKFPLVWVFCGLAANSVVEGIASVLTVDISRCRELETSKVGTIACQLFVSATTKHPLVCGMRPCGVAANVTWDLRLFLDVFFPRENS